MFSYSDIKQFYNDTKSDKVMKIITRMFFGCAVLAFLVTFVLFLVDGSKGKHVKYAYGLFERNIPKDYPDTVYKTIAQHDTIYKFVPVSNPKSKTLSETKSNPGTKTGNITAKNVAFGDENKVGDTYNYNEKRLTEPELKTLRDFMEVEKKKAGITGNCILLVSINSTPNNIITQIKKYLEISGYGPIEVSNLNTFVTEPSIAVSHENNCMTILVNL